jgi:hypothetical protein
MKKLSLLSRILLATGMMVAGTLSVAPQNKSESGGVLTLHLRATCHVKSAETAYRGLLGQFSDEVNNDFVLAARSGLDAIGSARQR